MNPKLRQIIEMIVIALILVIFAYFMVRTYIFEQLRGPLAKPEYYKHGEYDMEPLEPKDRGSTSEDAPVTY